MPVEFTINKLREKARRLHREYEALCVFCNTMTAEDAARFEYEKGRFAEARKPELHRTIAKLNNAIAGHRRLWGFRVPNSEVVKILEKAEQGRSRGQTLRLSKLWVSDICSGYYQHWIIFKDLPAHTMIEIDLGTFRKRRGQISWFLLEATVYEDLCALFNQAKEFDSRVRQPTSSNKDFKIRESLLRATVLLAFHFVEAYLNGLAFDYYASNQNRLTDETKSLLFDWNYKTDRPRYLSLRDKALQYPKIILGLAHPPLHEDNCSELRNILDAVEVRHRITHISPKREFERANVDEQTQVYSVQLKDVERIIDSCIDLVRRIDRLVKGETLRLHWLYNRTHDGTFPEKAFD